MICIDLRRCLIYMLQDSTDQNWPKMYYGRDGIPRATESWAWSPGARGRRDVVHKTESVRAGLGAFSWSSVLLTTASRHI